VQVLERALSLLDVLAAANKEVSPPELAGALHLHKSTVHRLLKVLEGYRLVRRSRLGKYDLGLKSLELGTVSVSRFNLPKRAEPFLEELVEETGETADICILSNTQMLSIANVESPWILRANGHRGGTAFVRGREGPPCFPSKIRSKESLRSANPYEVHA
jgi:IclR family acetate operon transcriptional repressor